MLPTTIDCPSIPLFSTMTDRDREQARKWQSFNPTEMMTRFRLQAGVGSIGLRPFFAAEMARTSAGCATDGLGMKASASGFHPAWQRDSAARMQTRGNGLHIFTDMVCFLLFVCQTLTYFHIQGEALDRTAGMGSISFHVHGERARNASIASNVVMYVSSALANNPAVEVAIANMRAIFTEEVAVAFAADWLTRTVDAGYLPSSVLCPSSSPIKASRSNRDQSPSVIASQTRQGRSLSHSSSISSASSLTDTASVANETTPTHSHSGFPSPTPRSEHSAAHISTGRTTQPIHGTILPATLTMLSTMTLSAPVIIQPTTGTGTADGPRTAAGVADASARLSEDVRELMASIGRDRATDHDMIWEIYNYTGRALWEATVAVRLNLGAGTARALVSLMLTM